MLTLIRGPITAIYLTKTSTPLTNLPAQTPQSAYSNGQKKKSKKKKKKKKTKKKTQNGLPNSIAFKMHPTITS
jgi:hypothetical protein